MAGPRDYEGPQAVEVAPHATPPADLQPAPEPTPDEPEPHRLEPAEPATNGSEPREPASEVPEPEPDDDIERVVNVAPRKASQTEPDRAGSVVTRKELDERLPRSAPDALRYEPGVYVQQTAHAQASPYVRGMTGQQTVLMFDGIRLNTSTFRQGPNQYFFTVDSRTIDSLEVIRGSASTRYGSDALGGVLKATPIEPSLDVGPRRFVFHPRGFLKTATADGEVGGRAQLGVSYRGKLGLLAGVGYRDVGFLRSGGPVIAPGTGETQKVPPAFDDDGKTQKGTGFNELTSDARLVWEANRKVRVSLGYYDYRQMDAPRTDKCPPPTAPEDECLRYPEQFKTLVYSAVDFHHGPAAIEDLRWTVSYQNQHERRRRRRGSPSFTEVHGRDDVHTIGTGLQANTKKWIPEPWFDAQILYGLDLYYDRLDSAAWLFYRDVQITSLLSRGQYVDKANYLTSGVWTEAQTTFAEAIRLRAGGRGAWVYAQANEDLESQTHHVNSHWVTAVGNAGISAKAVPWLSFHFNVDQGFRAPNLDDLTSRQQTGPGFQYENSALDPERSIGLEAGTKVEHRFIELEGWVFRTYVYGLIARAPRTASQCPEGDPGCSSSQTRFQLVNLDGRAIIQGVEGGLRLFLPWDLGLRATISYARGEGPNPVPRPASDPTDSYRERVPLSRIPPLNGTVEAGWRSGRLGFHVIGALRWATAQTRLALADDSDARIPIGGTPGFAVFDLRAGYRFDPHFLVGLVFENVADAPYRYHGSSINGPGRGLILNVEFGW